MITQYRPFDFPAGKDNTERGLFDRRAFPANSSPTADIAEGRLVGSRPNRKYCNDIPPVFGDTDAKDNSRVRYF